MQEIRAHSFYRIQKWLEDAINTSYISRFLSGSTFNFNFDPTNLGWDKQFFMSNDNKTLLLFTIDRTSKPEVSVSLWSLHKDRFARALSCGKALKFAEKAIKKLEARTVDFKIAESNTDSLHLAQKRFGNYFWGIKRKDLWDSELFTYVNAYCYRILCEDYI